MAIVYNQILVTKLNVKRINKNKVILKKNFFEFIVVEIVHLLEIRKFS